MTVSDESGVDSIHWIGFQFFNYGKCFELLGEFQNESSLYFALI